MYLLFAWRYFRSKKSTQAINIIAWVTTGVIVFATCCQLLVLSVFNGFEGLVKSLYTSFYTDLRIAPARGKTILINADDWKKLQAVPGIASLSGIVEEKALLRNGEYQTVIQLFGVDEKYVAVSGLEKKIIRGTYDIGESMEPRLVVGAGIQHAAGINIEGGYGPDKPTIILPKHTITSNDPLASISEGVVTASGVFSVQQEFDDKYAITQASFVRRQMGMADNLYSAVCIKLSADADEQRVQKQLDVLLGNRAVVQTRYQQNASLYRTMQTEKWAIYAILTLMLIIAAFNMVSALSMLILEKKQDIHILLSMGSGESRVQRIFISTGLLLGGMGTAAGVLIAFILCFLQARFHLIPITGNTFLIDYFPVKMVWSDLLLVIGNTGLIVLLASWLPARRAASSSIKSGIAD